jgi:hypothetical protein
MKSFRVPGIIRKFYVSVDDIFRVMQEVLLRATCLVGNIAHLISNPALLRFFPTEEGMTRASCKEPLFC